jgi:hypothetical protein
VVQHTFVDSYQAANIGSGSGDYAPGHLHLAQATTDTVANHPAYLVFARNVWCIQSQVLDLAIQRTIQHAIAEAYRRAPHFAA